MNETKKYIRLMRIKVLSISFLLILLFVNVFCQDATPYTPLMEQVNCADICKEKLDAIFRVLNNSEAFDWTDEDNNCEDRANAVSLILDSWGIANGKSWIFAGRTFDRKKFKGTLGGYSYHVASTVLVKNSKGECDTMVIDPLMNKERVMPLQEWIHSLTKIQENVYILTKNDHYQQNEISPNLTWKKREDYFQETLEGLTRYNSFSFWTRLKTKGYLKNRLGKVTKEFNILRSCIPNTVSDVPCNH